MSFLGIQQLKYLINVDKYRNSSACSKKRKLNLPPLLHYTQPFALYAFYFIRNLPQGLVLKVPYIFYCSLSLQETIEQKNPLYFTRNSTDNVMLCMYLLKLRNLLSLTLQRGCWVPSISFSISVDEISICISSTESCKKIDNRLHVQWKGEGNARALR